MELEDFEPASARLAIKPWASPFNVEFGVDYWVKDDITKDDLVIDEDFLMKDITSASELAALPADADRDAVRVYGFPAKDAERLAQVNAKVAGFLDTPKAERGGKKGEFSVGVLMLPDEATFKVICPHDPRRKYSAWIRVSSRESYRPLVEERRLAGIVRGVIEDMCKNRAATAAP